uniref:Uncharacterized protein n=1 Tax=Arundo donax TaxID=35708 RepID=A0A0A8YEE8_ARUDO
MHCYNLFSCSSASPFPSSSS